MDTQEQCLFCKQTAHYHGIGPLDESFEVSCNNCGNFTVLDEVKNFFDRRVSYRHIISGIIREKNDLGQSLEVITLDNITSIANDPLVPKTIMQKFYKILLHYYRKTNSYGDRISFNFNTEYAIGYASSPK